MKILTRFLKTGLVVVGLFGAQAALGYANTPQIDPNYNSRIIDDPIFVNAGTMSVTDIQNFLNGKVATCDSFHPNPDGSRPATPYICLKDYHDTDGRSAAQMIYDAATSLGINPQVILVTLQKEQSLVTDNWPYPSQYRSAMGYGCPDNGDCVKDYYGLSNQLTLGTKLLRVGHDRDCGNTSSFPGWSVDARWRLGNTTPVDGRDTYLGTCATGALYNYTPHRPDSAYTPFNGQYFYGNYNFVNFFTSWFGPTTIALAKTSDRPEIYLPLSNRKLLVPSPQIMAAYGLDTKPVSIVAQTYLDGLPSDGTLTTLAKKDNGSPTIFMIDSQTQYTVQSGQACTDWALDCFNSNVVKTLPSYIIEQLKYGGNLPTLFANQGAVYKPEGGKKRRVLDGAMWNAMGGAAVTRAIQDLNAGQPQGKLLISDGAYVKFDPNPDIYMYDVGQLHPIGGPEFAAWNAASKVTVVPASFNNDPLPVGAGLTTFGRDSAGAVYLVDHGIKILLSTVQDGWPDALLTTFGQNRLNELPRSDKRVLRSDVGTMYTAFQAKKVLFATSDDFFHLGFSVGDIQPVSNYPESLLTYIGLHLANGRLFKVVGSGDIRVISGGGSLYVPTTNCSGLAYDKIIQIDATAAARYPLTGTYPCK